MAVNNLTVSDKGLNLIRLSEGTIYHLYNDRTGNCTVGTGHLVHLGPICGAPSEAPYKDGCTKDQEADLLRHDVSFAEHVVNEHVLVPLNQGQFDALVDFVFNEGSKTFLKSSVLMLVNAGDHAQVPVALAKYKYSNGQVLDALITRRQREAFLYAGAS